MNDYAKSFGTLGFLIDTEKNIRASLKYPTTSRSLFI